MTGLWPAGIVPAASSQSPKLPRWLRWHRQPRDPASSTHTPYLGCGLKKAGKLPPPKLLPPLSQRLGPLEGSCTNAGPRCSFAIISLLAQLALCRCTGGKELPTCLYLGHEYLQGGEDLHFSRGRQLLPSLQIVASWLRSTHVCTSATAHPARGNLQ